MTMTDNLAVVVVLISMASLIVAIASIVMSAKNKRAGTVEPRTRAIEQIHEALSDLRQNQHLTPNPAPIRWRARPAIFNDPANCPAILDDGPVPQARIRCGSKLRGAQQQGHQRRTSLT
jgi:hypothetical protein